MKLRVVCCCVTVAASISLATAQHSQARSSSAKPARDPLQTAIKPLTPKSATTPRRRSSVVVPKASKSGPNATAELNQLERQNGKPGTSKSKGAGVVKRTSVPKSPDTTARAGSGINFKYEKPAGGMTATKPDARNANSSTPRVTKKN
jgi:hypothetical protein